jgi:hypothetical protein
VLGIRWDWYTFGFLLTYVGLTVTAAWMYDRRRWAPVALLAAVNAVAFVRLAQLGTWGPLPHSRQFPPLVAVRAAFTSAMPFTFSMMGVLLARRRSVPIRVAVGLGIGVFGPPIASMLWLFLSLLFFFFLGLLGSLFRGGV